MRKRKNKFIALLLSAVMIATLLPMTAFADVDLGDGDQQVGIFVVDDNDGDGDYESGGDSGIVSSDDNSGNSGAAASIASFGSIASVSGNDLDPGVFDGAFDFDIDFHGNEDFVFRFPTIAVNDTAPGGAKVMTFTNNGTVDISLLGVYGWVLWGDPDAFVVYVEGDEFFADTDEEGNTSYVSSFVDYVRGDWQYIIAPGESFTIEVMVNPNFAFDDEAFHEQWFTFDIADADGWMNDWATALTYQQNFIANIGVGEKATDILFDGPNVVAIGETIKIDINTNPDKIANQDYNVSIKSGSTGKLINPGDPNDPWYSEDLRAENTYEDFFVTMSDRQFFILAKGEKAGLVTIVVEHTLDGVSAEFTVLVVGAPDAPADDDVIPEEKVEELLQEITSVGSGGTITTDFAILGGNTLTPEILEALRDEGVALEISVGSGIYTGIKLVIEPDAIDDGPLTKPVNLELGFAFITEGVEVPLNDGKTFELADNSFLIIPPTSGDFGFELQIVIPESLLADWGLEVNDTDLKLYYMDKDGNFELLVYGEDWEIDGTDVVIKISSASSYILTNSAPIIHKPKPTASPSTQPTDTKNPPTQKKSGGNASTPSTKPAEVKQQPLLYRVATASLNERTGPGVNFPRVGVLQNGTLLEIKQFSPCGQWALAHTGTWVSVRFLEYVSGSLQTPDAVTDLTDYVVTINRGSRLNVRATAGGAVVGSLRAGDVVKVVKIENGWAQIAYTNQVPTAYVSARFLRVK